MEIRSELFTLANIGAKSPAWRFCVPIYQRLYVWGEDQVRTLLNDLVNAYERKEDLFFLGGTLLVEQPGEAGRHFDLIDGQQRFTTLWLLSHAWRELLRESFLHGKTENSQNPDVQPAAIENCTTFLTVEEKNLQAPRLRFAIRPEVNRFLESLVLPGHGQDAYDKETTERMRTALALMKSVFSTRSLPDGVTDRDAHLAGLTEFVFTKVKFVITTVPRETDLNKLFEIINNRGVQLQHHEILKARMLDALSERSFWDTRA
jgi:hypothetical protein